MFIILSFVWGSGFFLMKLGGYAFGPITMGASSTVGGSVFLWGFWFVNRTKWNTRKKHILPLLLIALFGYAFPFAAQPFLVNQIGHGFIGMMVSLVPILTIIVSIPILRILPSKIQLLGVLVGFSVLIPYIGAAAVTLPVAMVGLFQWGLAPDFWWLLVAYGIIQALDGNVLVPVLFSEAVNLHPVAIIVAVLVFGGLWGFWGIFFAIPLATLVKAVWNALPASELDDDEKVAE